MRIRKILGVIVALTLVTAACSDDDSESTDSGTTEEPETGAADAPDEADAPDDSAEAECVEPTEFDYMIAAPSFGLLDGLVALGAGLLEDECLSPNQTAFLPNSAQSTLAVTTGDADIAVTGFTGLLAAYAADRDVVAISGGASTPTAITTVSADFLERAAAQGVTPESSVAERMAMLEGALIGTTAVGGTSEQVVRAMLADFGVEATDDQFIALADQAALAAAVRENRIDALNTSPPPSLIPTVEGGEGAVWLSPLDDIPSYEGGLFTYAVTSRGYAEENPDVILAFQCAMANTHELLAADTAEVAASLVEFFPDLSEELLISSVQFSSGAFRGTGVEESQVATAIANFNLTAETAVDESTTLDDLFLDNPCAN